MGEVNHHAGENLNIALLCLNIYKRNRAVLDSVSQFSRHLGSRCGEKLSCRGINHILSQDMAADSVSEHQLLIEFISADFRQIISSGVEEHGID